MKYVQFSDSTQSAVVSVFSCPQDASVWPNQGAVTDDDLRYLAFADPKSTTKGARADQIAIVTQAFQAAASANVKYTSEGGVAETYQADEASLTRIERSYTLYTAEGATPSGFYWVAANNKQVAFTLTDLKNLDSVTGAQYEAAFQHLQTLKGQINAATTVAAVRAFTW